MRGLRDQHASPRCTLSFGDTLANCLSSRYESEGDDISDEEDEESDEDAGEEDEDEEANEEGDYLFFKSAASPLT